MNASQRTLKWIKDNPEKYKANQERSHVRKTEARDEALKAIKKTKYKTPMKAIRAYCRVVCASGECRAGFLYAIVNCRNKKCPLFAFRNGNPVRMKLHLKIEKKKKHSVLMRSQRKGT